MAENVDFKKFLFNIIILCVLVFLINALFSFGSWWCIWVIGLCVIALIIKVLKVYLLK
ncbi:MAG: hypothetical protein ACSW71_02780 [Methanobrevibacter sp.]